MLKMCELILRVELLWQEGFNFSVKSFHLMAVVKCI